VWHLPEFMGPSWAESSGGSGILDIRQIGKFVIFAMDITIVITWVFNNTKGSLLMAMLITHLLTPLSVPLRLLFGPADVFNSLLLSFVLLALLLVALIRGGWATNTIGQKNPIRPQPRPEEGLPRTPLI
jgi:uncharacterized protein